MADYTIRLATRSDGTDIGEATWRGQTFRATSRNGVTMAVARLLVGAGAPDGSWEGVGCGDGRKRLQGRTLHGLAKLSISEPDRSTFKLVPWQPYTRADKAA